jgi:hypothetical protein
MGCEVWHYPVAPHRLRYASFPKDLDIHEHRSTHVEAKLCDLSLLECGRLLWVAEVMIGAPQGELLSSCVGEPISAPTANFLGPLELRC